MVRVMGHEYGEIEHLSRDLRLVAAALFAAGVVIIAAGTARMKENAAALTGGSAALIGIVQALCLPFADSLALGRNYFRRNVLQHTAAAGREFQLPLAVALTPAVVVYELYRLLKPVTCRRAPTCCTCCCRDWWAWRAASYPAWSRSDCCRACSNRAAGNTSATTASVRERGCADLRARRVLSDR